LNSKKTFLTNVLWSFFGQYGYMVVGLVGNIVLARFLMPEEFGQFGIAMFFVGFDINTARIAELMSVTDSTLEVGEATLQGVLKKVNSLENGLYCSNKLEELKECNYYIITVPIPLLTPLVKASETVGAVLAEGDIVIYESTVYPRATEEECIPVLEKFLEKCSTKILCRLFSRA
jgi:UDP-N-acetyl-D-mannosaminuronate dehydrogenase